MKGERFDAGLNYVTIFIYEIKGLNEKILGEFTIDKDNITTHNVTVQKQLFKFDK